jgi:CheY-like chemotaxis protein
VHLAAPRLSAEEGGAIHEPVRGGAVWPAIRLQGLHGCIISRPKQAPGIQSGYSGAREPETGSRIPSRPTMAKPILLSVDDDADVLRAIERDLRSQYGADYRVLGSGSPQGALDLLKQLKLRSDSVALLLADQRMPHMDGVHFLQEAMGIYPEAKRALLTAYADTTAAIGAINQASIRNWTIYWKTGRLRTIPPIRASAFSARAGPPSPMSCAISWRAITSPTSGLTRKFPPAIRRPSFCWRPWGPRPPAFPSCYFPTARNFSNASRRKWRRKSACGRARKPVSTIWPSSAEGPRALPPPCTERRKACTR